MRLDRYDKFNFDRGAGSFKEASWLLCEWLFLSSWFPGTKIRVFLLRRFGAQIGTGVVINPGVRIKFPWRLKIGNHSWIGRNVWLDNLAEVNIGNHCCISQDVYFCTGNHDWTKESFDLLTKPISIENSVWICARATIGPGVRVGEGAVLSLGSVANWNLDAGWIYQGVPAAPVRERYDDESINQDFTV